MRLLRLQKQHERSTTQQCLVHLDSVPQDRIILRDLFGGIEKLRSNNISTQTYDPTKISFDVKSAERTPVPQDFSPNAPPVTKP